MLSVNNIDTLMGFVRLVRPARWDSSRSKSTSRVFSRKLSSRLACELSRSGLLHLGRSKHRRYDARLTRNCK